MNMLIVFVLRRHGIACARCGVTTQWTHCWCTEIKIQYDSLLPTCVSMHMFNAQSRFQFFLFFAPHFFQYSQFQNVSYGLDLAQKLNKHIWYRKVYSWFMIEYARLMLPIKWIRIVFVCKNIYSCLLLSFVCINFQNIVIKYTIYCNLWICFFFLSGH